MPSSRPLPKPIPSAQSGFTLIELMVSSILLGLTVSAVAIMIINSSALRLSNDHNRQARYIALEEMEDPVHHFYNYPVPALAGTIQLDFAEAGQSATTATRTVTTANNLNAVILGINVPYQRVTSTVTWTENGTRSVSLIKRLTAVK